MRFANRFSRRPPSEPRQNHLADSRQADDQRRALRNVDDTSAAERSAVVDPSDDGAAGALVRDLEAGAERQAAMGGRQRLAVKRLAVTGPGTTSWKSKGFSRSWARWRRTMSCSRGPARYAQGEDRV